MKRCGMPDKPTWVPTSAPVSIALAMFFPPPLDCMQHNLIVKSLPNESGYLYQF